MELGVFTPPLYIDVDERGHRLRFFHARRRGAVVFIANHTAIVMEFYIVFYITVESMVDG